MDMNRLILSDAMFYQRVGKDKRKDTFGMVIIIIMMTWIHNNKNEAKRSKTKHRKIIIRDFENSNQAISLF